MTQRENLRGGLQAVHLTVPLDCAFKLCVNACRSCALTESIARLETINVLSISRLA